MTLKKENNLTEKAPPIPEVYANAAMANISIYEFELTLGLGSSNYEGVRPVVNLRMSPQFAKELSQILAENVELYEQNFGEIAVVEKEKQ